MNCEQIQEEIAEQFDEARSLPLRKEVIEHLARCDKCRQVYDDVETIRSKLELDRVFAPSLPEWSGLSDKVWGEVSNVNRSKPQTKSRGWRWQHYPKSKFLPAALVMAVMFLVISTNYLTFRYGAIVGSGGHDNESFVEQLPRNRYTENPTERITSTNSHPRQSIEAITGDRHDGSLELMTMLENKQKLFESDRVLILLRLKQLLQTHGDERKIEVLINELNENNLRYLNEQISLQKDFIREYGVRQLANCLVDDASPLSTEYFRGCKGVSKH